MKRAILGVWLALSPGIIRATFQPTTPLPEAFYAHVTLASNGYLYKVGGIGLISGILGSNTVYYAQIHSDGTLGAWRAAATLPAMTFYHTGVVVNGFLYVLGGDSYDPTTGFAISNSVFYSKIQPDGSLGAWFTASALPQAVIYPSASSWNGTIYITGGLTNTSDTNAVYFASVNPDGSLGSWQATTPLPTAVYTHTAVENNKLYVIGGAVNNGQTIVNKVLCAAILPDKTLGPWTTVTSLPTPLQLHSSQIWGNTIYVTGGFDGTNISAAVYANTIASDGSLGPWTTSAPMPQALQQHGATAANGYLYITGGHNGAQAQSAVYFEALPSSAPVIVDVLPPRTTLSVGLPNYGANPEFVSPATQLSLGAVDDLTTVGDGLGAGVQNTQWAVDGGLFTAYQNPFTIGADGSHWVQYYSIDKAGNTETVHSARLAVDGTAPISTATAGSPRAQLASGSVIVGPLTGFTVSAIDPAVNGVASGVAVFNYGIDNAPLTPAPSGLFNLPAVDGTHTVGTQATDNVQNAEILHRATFFMDATPPATTVQAAPSPYIDSSGNAVLNAASVVSFAAADPVVNGVASGVHHTQYSIDGGGFAAVMGGIGLAEGKHVVNFNSVDNVGNTEPARSASYWVDATPPQTTLTVGGGTTLFGVDMVTPSTPLTLSAQDPVSNGVASGVAKILYSIDGGGDQAYAAAFTLTAGVHTISYGAVDNAGNAETRHAVSISVGMFLTDALAGADSITLSGGAGVTGTVRTNGSFTANGRSTVTGDVYAMTATLTGHGAVAGTVHQGQATLPTPSFDLASASAWAQANNNNAAIPSELIVNGALVLSGNQQLTLAAGNYYFTGLSVVGQASLSVSGQAGVFLHGPLAVSGNGLLNSAGDATKLWIVADTGDVALSGNGRTAANIYAPNSSVTVSGNGAFAGRILGRSAALSGNALEPSTTTLPAPQHHPGSPEHRPGQGNGPGSGTASPGHDNGKDDLVLSASLSHQDPSLVPTSHDGVLPPSSNPPSSPAPGSTPSGKAGNPLTLTAQSKAFIELHLSSIAALSLIPTTGGSVQVEGQAQVSLPDGAMAQGLMVTVLRYPGGDGNDAARRAAMAAKGLTPASQGTQFGPEGTRFQKPVIIVLNYDRSLLPPGFTEDSLKVHYWNPGTKDWEALDSTVDKIHGTVSAQTNHFSLYQVMAGAASPSASASGAFALGQSYVFPNPATHGASPVIHVEAGSADSLDIRIFDVSGRLVHSVNVPGPAPLIDDGSGRGAVPSFEYRWDTGGVGSGVYIYVATAHKGGFGGLTTKGKVVVVK